MDFAAQVSGLLPPPVLGRVSCAAGVLSGSSWGAYATGCLSRPKRRRVLGGWKQTGRSAARTRTQHGPRAPERRQARTGWAAMRNTGTKRGPSRGGIPGFGGKRAAVRHAPAHNTAQAEAGTRDPKKDGPCCGAENLRMRKPRPSWRGSGLLVPGRRFELL